MENDTVRRNVVVPRSTWVAIQDAAAKQERSATWVMAKALTKLFTPTNTEVEV